MKSGACFDPTGAYRYSLWRIWNHGPWVTFVMLNPSTADAEVNDATIRRCVCFAQRWGYGALEVVNLFALRTPYPQTLRVVEDPVGAECDAHILTAVARADQVVLGWGNWGKLYHRDRAVLDLLTPYSNIYCLGLNQSGQPRHPLYLKQTVQPIPYDGSANTQSLSKALT